MAITLIINPGSSSKKYTLYRNERVIAQYRFERNTDTYELCEEKSTGAHVCEVISMPIFSGALKEVLTRVCQTRVLGSLERIDRVGMRVVAPGSYFQHHRVVDELYLEKLVAVTQAAPLHIPHIVQELQIITEQLPGVPVIAVSDSAFHATLPTIARTYPINTADAKSYDVYRFGYHGLSIASISRQLPKILPQMSRVVVCHIGSGMSMTALKNGVSIETTMGFGPGSGLMMGSRVGDIDPSALLELQRSKKLSLFDMQTYLQTAGGFAGLVGESDFRQLLHRHEMGDTAVQEAFALCRYRFQKALAEMQMVLGGIDVVVCTATAFERSAQLRAVLFANLEWFGITLDATRNEETIAKDGIISTGSSPIMVAVLRTDEAGELWRATTEMVLA